MIDFQFAIKQATTLLSQTSTSARLDAEILLCHLLNTTRTVLYTHPETQLTPAQWADYQALIDKRATGTPVSYLTKKREFWSLDFMVSEATLIPRSDTELLVEKTLQLLDESLDASILELGTGSGAIALALASMRPHWHIVAVDNSDEALCMASANAKQLMISNVDFLLSDWFYALKNQAFHAIVSNPPYLAADDPHLLQGDLRFEPKSALVSGIDGLESLHYIIKHSYPHLLEGGILLLEHGYQQGEAVTSMLKECGYREVTCWQDWQGHDRVSSGRRGLSTVSQRI